MGIQLGELLNYGSKSGIKCIINNESKNTKKCYSLISAISNKNIVAEKLVNE